MGCLEGKKAIVTGSTAGIGKAIAIAFAKEGADVVVVGTREEKAKEVVAEIQAISPSCKTTYRLIDVANFQQVNDEVASLLEEFKDFDILVNNAGITKDSLLMRMSEEDWDRVIDVNLKSVFNFAKALIRPMMKKRKGKIINISSVIGLVGNAGQINYAASKAGVIGVTKSMAKEFAKKNICVNCIAPGYIQTQMTQSLSEDVTKAIINEIPMRRVGQVEDIANAAVFLASEASDYITGQVLTVDGGMVM